MEFFKRIGTSRHKYKAKFTSVLKEVTLQSEIAGNHKTKMQNPVTMDSKKCNFCKEMLQLEAVTLFMDDETKQYQEKIGEIRVIMINKKDQKKLLGTLDLDIAQYANKHEDNIQQSQELLNAPQGFDIVLNFQVYIKYIGEGSETSKSVNKQSKGIGNQLSNFLTGFISNDNESKNAQRSEDNKNNYNQNSGRQMQPRNNHRNLVKTPNNDKSNIKNGNNHNSVSFKQFNQKESLKTTYSPKITMKDQSSLKQELYFDDTGSNKNKPKGNSIQDRRLKKAITPQNSDDQKKRVEYWVQKSKQNQNEIKELKEQNQRLKQQLAQINQEQRDTISVVSSSNPELQLKIRSLERQRNQKIVLYEKLKEKYQKDCQKYEQLLQNNKDDRKQVSQSSKAQLKRLKQQCSNYRIQNDEINQKYITKSQQAAELQTQNKYHQDRVIALQTQLSSVKLRICDKLNQANQKQQQQVIDSLTELINN